MSSTLLRVLPLDAVLFPGMRLSAHVTEPRLCRLIERLAASQDASTARVGVVAVREGYRIGRRYGRQSAHRVGCEAALSRATARTDGSWDVEIEGRRRMRVARLMSERPEVVATVTYPPEIDGPDASDAAAAALTTFEAYRNTVADHGGQPGPVEELPTAPLPLSYSLATAATLSLRDRQLLLEAPHAAARLERLTVMLRLEMTAIRAVASLPATRLARTGWSPN